VSGAAFEKVAREAALAAGKVLLARFRSKELRVEMKGLHDFVTEVDRAAEETVIRHIHAAFPDHAVMAEEGSPTEERTEYRWVVDPLDGTTNFIHGVTPFSVSIALEDRNGLVAATIHDPFHDETFHAHRGGGAFLNDEPIRCTDPERSDQTLIATGFPFRELSRLGSYIESFETFVRSTAGIRRAGSAAIDLAYTACGRYDGFWEIGLSRWDIAAGTLIVREAGGVVTDVVGGESHLDSGDILAAGPRLHGIMLEVTQRAFGAPR
jgi:myo-inositol-1(or 4)-monophosphatase